MFKITANDLNEICCLADVQDPEYEGKTERQQMKMTNGKVDNSVVDKEKTEVLNNTDKAATAFKTNGSETINSGRIKDPSGTEDANLAITHSTES